MKSFIASALLILVTVAACGADIPANEDAPEVEGAPLSAVVITQCNSLVAAYATMPNGTLVRFDASSGLPFDKVLEIAYSARRSERIEISCDSIGVKGYEGNGAETI